MIELAAYAGCTADAFEQMPEYWRNRYAISLLTRIEARRHLNDLQARADAFNRQHGHG